MIFTVPSSIEFSRRFMDQMSLAGLSVDLSSAGLLISQNLGRIVEQRQNTTKDRTSVRSVGACNPQIMYMGCEAIFSRLGRITHSQ